MVLGQLLAGVVAPDVFTRTVTSIAQSGAERRRLAKNVRERTGLRPGRAWHRWLSREINWELIIVGSTDGYDELVAELMRELQRQIRLPWRRPSTLELKDRARRLTSATIEGVIETLEPSRAVAASGARVQQDVQQVSQQLTEVGLDVRAGLGVDERAQDRLARLPFAAAASVGRLLAEQRPEGSRLLEMFTSDRPPLEVARSLLVAPPAWLQSASADGWLAVAESAEAYAPQHAIVAELFQKAADVSADRGQLMLRAALAAARAGDAAGAHKLVTQAETLHADPVLVTVLRAAIDDDLAAIADVALQEVHEQLWACMLLVEAARRHGDASAALIVAERALARHPQASGLRLYTARLLLEIFVQSPARSTRHALGRAIDLSLQVRDERRRWGGDSAVAVVVACEAALMMGDQHRVLQLGRQQPAGEATPTEAGSAAVAVLVAHAAAQAPDVVALQEAIAVVNSVGSPFDRALLSGHLLRLQGATHAEEVAAYRQALILAPTDRERAHAKYVLAACGEPVELRDDTAGTDEAQQQVAAMTRAVQAEEHNDHQSAIEILRPWAARSAAAAELLAESYRRNGEPQAAARTLIESGQRFGAAHLVARAAEILAAASLRTEAEAAAERALSLGGLPAAGLKGTHLLLIQLAQQQRDWPKMRTRTETALLDLPDDQQLRWILVGACVNAQLFDAGWRELTRPPKLTPGSPHDAQLAMALTQLFLHGAARSRALLELLAYFPDDPDVQVAAIVSFLGDEHDDLGNDEAGQWRELISRFTSENPQHPAFYTIDLPEDDPEGMVKALLDHIPPRPVDTDALATEIAEGRKPYGMLSAAAGKPYSVALLHRAAGCLPIGTLDPAISRLELEAARAAVDGELVIDSSTLTVALAVPGLWRAILTLFETVHTTMDARADVGAAKLYFDRAGTGMLGRHGTDDRLVLTEHDPVVMEQLRARAASALDATENLTVSAHQIHDPRLADAEWADDPRFTPWMGLLDLALARSIPYLCDDLALRGIARELGAPSFGILALLQLLEETGRVTPVQARQWRQDLRAYYCVDLPFNASELADLAQSQSWQPGPATAAVARPALWEDPYATLRLVNYAFLRTATNSNAAAGWLYAAILGFGRGRPARIVHDFAQALLFRALSVMEEGITALPVLLPAAQQACDRLGAPGLLEGLVGDLMQQLTMRHPNDVAFRMVLGLMVGLPELERRQVLERLIIAP